MDKPKKNIKNRILAMVLSMSITFGMLPMAVYAEPVFESDSTGNAESSASSAPENEEMNETDTSDSAMAEDSYILQIGEMPEDVKSAFQITLNDNTEAISVQEDAEVKISINAADNTDKHYLITAVKIGETILFTDSAGQAGYEGAFKVTPEMADENGNIKVTFEVAEIYIVQFSYNSSNSGVEPTIEYTAVDETDSARVIGTVALNQDVLVGFTATPAEHYRVAEIRIDENTQKYEENDKAVTIDAVEANQNHIVEVVFAPNIYQVKADETIRNGTITVTSNTVNYGDACEVTVTANDGWYINSISVNGEKVAAGEVNSGVFTIADIAEDKVISAEFLAKVAASVSDFSWNSNEAISGDGRSYVFGKEKTIVFSTEKTGVRLIAEDGSPIAGNETVQLVSLTQDMASEFKVSAVEVYYQDSAYTAPYWHRIALENTLELSFYEGAAVKLTLPELNAPYTCYHSDVKLGLEIEVPDGYPAVKSIEYWLNDDVESTQISAMANEITISAEENNGADQTVTVRVTDEAGHVTEIKSDHFSINSIAPTVTVKMDGTLADDASEGYYCDVRTATISISDRKDTFNESADAFSVIKDGAELSDEQISGMLEWSESGDTLIAVLKFTEDGVYEWRFCYTNLAGMYNETTVDSGDSIYNFTIDSAMPEISVRAQEQTWNKVLSVLTFGMFSKSEIPVTVDVEDVLSGIKEITYFKAVHSDALNEYTEEAMTFAELESIYCGESEGKAFLPYTDSVFMNENEKAVVYIRVIDHAGNVVYCSTDGLIVDNQKPQLVSVETEQDTNIILNDPIVFNVTVNDTAAANEAFSGIHQVYYLVTKDGRQIGDKNIIYTWDVSEDTLRDSWSGSFELNPHTTKLYNQDKLEITVGMVDNAGNVYEELINEISMNVDELVISVEFEDDVKENRLDNSYFQSRTATVTICNDRSSSFNAENATAAVIGSISAVNITDEAGEPVEAPEDLITISEWKTESNDENTHYATVIFNYCGNYTWKNAQYVNNAQNSQNILKQDTIAFTIDTVAPTGEVTVSESMWDKLWEFLTFGLYSSDKLDVTAKAEDMTSPVQIEYYISNNTNAMDSAQLDALLPDDWKVYTDQFTISEDGNYVVYLRITDYAGNYIYVNSDGHIIDGEQSIIQLIPDEANDNGIYNKDVNVQIVVTDPKPYSGIKSVEYWVTSNGVETQREVLLLPDLIVSSYEDLCSQWKESIVIDAQLNNSCDVVLYVEAVDNAGNPKTESIELDIDVTAPEIVVSYDNNSDNGGNAYFDAARTATVVITERAEHFDAQKALENIKITAVDINGQSVDSAYTISNWITKEGETPDEDTHTATILYEMDANYEFSIAYIDKADNSDSGVNTGGSAAPYKFTVDKTAPMGSITAISDEGRSETWENLVQSLNFGFWSNSGISISETHADLTSPVDIVEYYKLSASNASDAVDALTAAQLDAVTKWQEFSIFKVVPNEQFTVYLKLEDMAGNRTYISTNGLIADDNAPSDEMTAPEINATPQQSESGIYNSDVIVSVTVDDGLVGGTYSGLHTVSYRVLNMGMETQNETLYTFDENSPLQSQLLKTWTGSIVVDSALNNSNDVIVEIYAEDNARNSSIETISLKIDTTAPVIQVSYDNNSANGTLFKESRTARITITERNFDEKYVNIPMTLNDAAYGQTIVWSRTNGSGNGNDTTWYTEIDFSADGDYTFDVNCTDLAANQNIEVQYGNSTHPNCFTVDRTAPQITVSFNDTDNTPVDNYYKGTRTATITVNEVHFHSEMAAKGVVIKADNDGEAVKVSLGSWTSRGTTHSAVLTLSEDAEYSLEISYTDLAGNAAESYSSNFYVDNIDPALSVTVNGKEKFGAYNEGVLPVISYYDVNFDSANVDVELSASSVEVSKAKVQDDTMIFNLKTDSGKTLEWQATIADNKNHYGQIVTFENFPDEANIKEFDDIYTLSVSLTDKSGRQTKKTLTFSVNRYGSTYDISALSDLLGAYVQEERNVVVSEINPDELVEYSITVFKNNETLTLTEGSDYDVESVGSDGQWHEYKYSIHQSVFEEDGIYSIVFHSKDKAGNVSENTLDTKQSDISFAVDKTPPTALIANLEDGKTYAEETKTIIVTADDNLKLASVVAYLDDEVYQSWNQEQVEELLANGGEFTFDITDESNKSHDLRLVCTDASGRITEVSVTDFYVTMDMWVRFINNKLVFIGTLIGLFLGISGLIVFIVHKRKRTHNRGI